MIFLATLGEPPGLFCFITEKDFNFMRSSEQTVNVWPQQLGGHLYQCLTLAYASDDEAAKQIIVKAGHGNLLKGAASPTPTPDQEQCEGCASIMGCDQIYKGRCVGCWYRECLRLKSEKN